MSPFLFNTICFIAVVKELNNLSTRLAISIPNTNYLVSYIAKTTTQHYYSKIITICPNTIPSPKLKQPNKSIRR